METVLNQITSIIVQVISSILVLFFCNLLLNINKQIKAQIKSDKLNNAIKELENVVTESIYATEQTFVKQIKSGKRWDTNSQKQALEICVNAVLASLSESTTETLKENEEEIVNRITQMIESKLGELHYKK